MNAAKLLSGYARMSDCFAKLYPFTLCRTVYLPSSMNYDLFITVRFSCLSSINYSKQNIHTILSNKPEVGINTEQKKIANHFLCAFEGRKTLSCREWKKLKQDVVSSSKRITSSNFDGVLMKYLLAQENYTVAKSYITYLKTNNLKPNIATLSAYMAICGSCLSESSEDEIFNTYECLQKLIKTLDSETAENVIKGLCVTSRWKETTEILKFHVHTKPTASSLNSVAKSAFRHNDIETAFQIMEEIINLNRKPSELVYNGCINLAFSMEYKDSVMLMERLFNFINCNMILVSKTTAEEICTFYKSHKNQKWKGVFTYIDRHGKCNTCNKQLKSLQLTEEEFIHLRQAVLSRVLEGSDVFLNTSPIELSNYKKFVSKTMPYDVVLDGLNISYVSNKHKNIKVGAQQLQFAVQHFVKNQKKVLVLGRKHMLQWPKRNLKVIQDIAECFFVDDISHDDPFLLYAAMMSGLKTLVVSKDLMRNHIFLLNDSKLSNLFKRWQKSHQMYLLHIGIHGEVLLQGPLKHSILVQGNLTEGLHIPYEDSQPNEPYEEQNNWLCMQIV